MMENRDAPSLDGGADDIAEDSSGGNQRNAPARRTTDLTEANIRKDDFVDEFSPEVPATVMPPLSSAPSVSPRNASLSATSTLNYTDDHVLAPGGGDSGERLEHAPPSEPTRPPRQQMVVARENPGVVAVANKKRRQERKAMVVSWEKPGVVTAANNTDVAPGAYPTDGGGTKCISLADLTTCRSTVSFDTSDRDTTTGSTIPTELGLLTQLTYLRVYFNQLTSSIPTELALLSQLTF